MQNVFHFKTEIFQLASRIVRQIPGKFLAIHWRRGDFANKKDRKALDTEQVVEYFRNVCNIDIGEKYVVYIGQPATYHVRSRYIQALGCSSLFSPSCAAALLPSPKFDPALLHFIHCYVSCDAFVFLLCSAH
jgi:hypothetical protein